MRGIVREFADLRTDRRIYSSSTRCPSSSFSRLFSRALDNKREERTVFESSFASRSRSLSRRARMTLSRNIHAIAQCDSANLRQIASLESLVPLVLCSLFLSFSFQPCSPFLRPRSRHFALMHFVRCMHQLLSFSHTLAIYPSTYLSACLSLALLCIQDLCLFVYSPILCIQDLRVTFTQFLVSASFSFLLYSYVG